MCNTPFATRSAIQIHLNSINNIYAHSIRTVTIKYLIFMYALIYHGSQFVQHSARASSAFPRVRYATSVAYWRMNEKRESQVEICKNPQRHEATHSTASQKSSISTRPRHDRCVLREFLLGTSVCMHVLALCSSPLKRYSIAMGSRSRLLVSSAYGGVRVQQKCRSPIGLMNLMFVG